MTNEYYKDEVPKLKIVTDGTVSSTKVFDEDGNLLGNVASVEIKAKEYITLINVGNDTFKPTPEDLEVYRDAFDKAKDDVDFRLFTHDAVKITRIPKDDEAILNWNFKMLLR